MKIIKRLAVIVLGGLVLYAVYIVIALYRLPSVATLAGLLPAFHAARLRIAEAIAYE